MLRCVTCNKDILGRMTAKINIAKKTGAKVFCDKACYGVSRRRKVVLTDVQKKEIKRIYDEQYRIKKAAIIKAQKAAWYKKTADRDKEREYRKTHMQRHVEYCRRPEYKEWKSEYDSMYRAKKQFGEFATAALLLLDLEKEVLSQASRYEIALTNGVLNKAQQRRRAL